MVGLLVGYWALMTFVPVPGIGAGSFAPDANLANWIDAHYLPGRLWDNTRDPEGCCRRCRRSAPVSRRVCRPVAEERAFRAAAEVAHPDRRRHLAAAAGYLWGLQFPVIKAIWTSSFVLVAGGYSLMLLGACHQVIDVWGMRAWATAFIWIGANAILLYFLNSTFGFEPFALRFIGGDLSALIDRLTETPATGRFLAHVLGLTFAILLARFFYSRKIFLRV